MYLELLKNEHARDSLLKILTEGIQGVVYLGMFEDLRGDSELWTGKRATPTGSLRTSVLALASGAKEGGRRG